MITECPKCGMRNAYHNSVSYICTDCSCEWVDHLSFEEENEGLEEDYDYEYDNDSNNLEDEINIINDEDDDA